MHYLYGPRGLHKSRNSSLIDYMVSYIPILRLKCNANQIKIQSCGIFTVPRKPDTLIVYVQLQNYIGQRIDD